MKKSGFFCVKTFVIFVIIMFILVLVGIKIWSVMEKRTFEAKKQEAKENPLKAYEIGVNSTFADYVEACAWSEDDIDRVVIGIDIDGEGINKYYIDDSTLVKQVINIFSDVTFCGANRSIGEKKDSVKWTVQFLKGNEKYSLFFVGYDIGYDNIELGDVDSKYADDDKGANISFPAIHKEGVYFDILYDEKMYDKLLEIYNENIGEITVDILKKLKEEESVNLTDYFRYIHTRTWAGQFFDENNKMRTSHIFKFSIKDSECYVEVEKFSENSSDERYNCLDIRRVELFNKAGESIDLFECTDEEFDRFFE